MSSKSEGKEDAVSPYADKIDATLHCTRMNTSHHSPVQMRRQTELFRERGEEPRAAVVIQSLFRRRLAQKYVRGELVGPQYEKVWDDDAEAAYYHHIPTGESLWDKPPLLGGDDIPFTPRSERKVLKALALLEGKEGGDDDAGSHDEDATTVGEPAEARAARQMAEWRQKLAREFDLHDFLVDLDLQEYEDILVDMGLDSYEHVLTIEDEDLDAMGMLSSHKRRLLKAVGALNRNMAAVGVEAFGEDPDEVLAGTQDSQLSSTLGEPAPGGRRRRKSIVDMHVHDGVERTRKSGKRPSIHAGSSAEDAVAFIDNSMVSASEVGEEPSAASGHGGAMVAAAASLEDGDDFVARPAGAPSLEEEAAATIVLETEFPGDDVNFPATGEVVRVHYTAFFADGTQFEDSRDRGRPLQFKLGIGQVCKGFEVGVRQMSRGQRAKFVVPAILAYGTDGLFPIIPPHAAITFQVQLIDFFDSNVVLTPRQQFDAEIDGTPRTAFGGDEDDFF